MREGGKGVRAGTEKRRNTIPSPSPAISFLRVTEDTSSSVRFPESVEDLSGDIDFDFIPAQVELPPTLFRTRAARMGRKGGEHPSSPQSEENSSNFDALPLVIKG